jgi:hypothetical protein
MAIAVSAQQKLNHDYEAHLLKHADDDDAEPFIPRRGLCKAIAVMGAQNVEDFIELMTMERFTDELDY